jgi:hypothetical protein
MKVNLGDIVVWIGRGEGTLVQAHSIWERAPRFSYSIG